MSLRTYRAYTMAEALAAVKRDLGARATILNTRSFKRGRFFGLWRQTVVEVTVATGDDAAGASTVGRSRTTGSRRTSAAPAQAAQRAYGGAKLTPGRPISNLEARKIDLLAAIEEHQRSASQPPARRAATTEPSGQKLRLAAVTNTPAPAAAEPRPTVSVAPEIEPKVALQSEPVAPVAQRFILQPADESEPAGDAEIMAQTSQPRSTAARPHVAPATSPGGMTRSPVPGTDAAQSELHAIHQMVSQIFQQQTLGATGHGGGGLVRQSAAPMPQHVFDTYLQLIGQDLSEELASEVIEQVQADLSADELADPEAVRRTARRRLMALVPTAEEPMALPTNDGRPRTIALIGPTGVGKTTTLAKLAATFKLRHQRRVGLITSDTYRIAAVEQLRTYATIIGLPLKVVLTPEEMTQACHQLRDCDVILIDTAGRSQKDHERLDELSSFIAAANPHEVHLVLSSTAGEKVLMQEAESFSRVRIDRIILTKLDEAVSFGMLINVVRKVGKGLSFLTTGQEVPDHIEPGRPDRLAGLLLGEEVRA